MADESKSSKKGSITEEDAAALIQRYPVETVLTLLQEVERVAGDKIDWDELVKNTATGISCAREYQMLWRHLAYGQNLEDEIDSDAKPLARILFRLISLLNMNSVADDDSDLEYELEASPDVTPQDSATAAACVKLLIASGSKDSHLPDDSTIDAPLTITVRSTKAYTASDSSLPEYAVRGTKVVVPVSVKKSTGGLTPRKNRKDWSEEEDMKLTAAVQKYGEPDWANIAKGDFENGRSASELFKRWTRLTKKLHNSNVGSSSQLSENDPSASDGATPMDETSNETKQINTGHPISEVPKRMPPIKRTTIADSVKAAAIAAGARIGTSTEASSLVEASRSQNVVHLKAAAGSVMRRYRARSNEPPSNVPFIRDGMAKEPSSSYSAPVLSAARADQPNPVGAARVLSMSSEETDSTASIPSVEPTKHAEGSTSGSGIRESAQKDQMYYQYDSPISSPYNELAESEESGYQASSSSGDPGNDTLDAHVPMECSEDEELGDEGVEAGSSNSMATTEDEE
ncbi:DNA binding protein [Dorcoceras hygrometricum]|uniref:DNA binding protein n=1 Tax=Dorcoceras hygrometricum TaxID=472368 RepID=A0A2Z7BHT7_9LAMI|nr:DNA binding protein [Dorcoceras hygrometricum]